MPIGMLNRYTCQECSKSIITKDINEGTTPFMILCRATVNCPGVMYSSWYRCDQSLDPDYEWFKPKSLKGYSPEMIEHIKLGGLDLRKVGTLEGILE